jgi:hypothetical protein
MTAACKSTQSTTQVTALRTARTSGQYTRIIVIVTKENIVVLFIPQVGIVIVID